MRALLLRGGRVIDPSQGLDDRVDLLIADGRIARWGRDLQAPESAETVDLAPDCVISPGFVDLHAHLREPGGEHKETIASGARAAAAGGFTSVCAMPNTDPPIDDPAAVGFVRAEGMRAGAARVYPVAAATVGSQGTQMTEIGELVQAGAVAVTDDGRPIASSKIMRRLLEYTQTFGIPVLSHAEELALSGNGVMNEGLISTTLGLQGIPNAAEDVMVARDVILAGLTAGHVHICHVSTQGAVELIRAAKARGVNVTAEVTPHHLTLTDEAVQGYRTECKVNPPLRSRADVEAVRAALVEGVIDCVATDHAPHHYEEKEREFDDAPFGVVGLETALGVSLKVLVEPGLLDLAGLIDRLACRPARIVPLPEGTGTLAAGAPGDVTVFDPTKRTRVRPERFHSRSRNTPFAGWELPGVVLLTIVGGRVVHRGEAQG
ncbi:MAG: dihydroorotase [Gemmatimonadetes bacterium]|nr:dihydroorotase [Gemmatimonadota bacterium]